MTRTLRGEIFVAAPEQSYSRATHRRNLMLLWAGQFVNTAGLMMLVPIMPFYLQGMGTGSVAATQTWAGVAIAAPALALTVATPLWGRIGDRVGRKWMVVRALLGLAVAMGVMATATTPLLLVAGRLLQGTLGGVVEAAAAFAGSVGSGKKRGSSLGKSFSATAAGALVGPVAGGVFVGAGGLRPLMLVIAAAAVLLAAACALGLHEPASEPTGDNTPTGASRRTRRPSVTRVPGAVPLALAAIGAYFGVYGLIPVFAAQVSNTVPDQGSASLWVGVLYSVMWGATLLGSFWWGKHNDISKRPLRTFALAAAACAVSIAPLALPLDPALLIPLRLVQGFAFAALAQSLFLHFGNHAPQQHRSGFVSSANSFLLIGQAAGPLLAGPLIGLMPVAPTIVVMATACAIGSVLAAEPARTENTTSGDTDNPEYGAEPRSEEASEEQTAPLPLIGTEHSPQRR
ncbi:MFS family permease [Saccharopolyspora lacisalsi]|uniref:MFS family permease n=1 Tax=Halosaccharopolyspora lacisalsi TaxID=1000566 RepID=A0A839DXD5_9PSEU|nr:MFS transporter [Halosaccharopolyspora lacisalsi]MBA8824107.1 MFS family permease [Halosaccharopolyspora lacisalsi]